MLIVTTYQPITPHFIIHSEFENDLLNDVIFLIYLKMI